MSHTGLYIEYWKFSMATAVHVTNRLPTNANRGRSPFELWAGIIPDVSHLRIWENTHVPAQKRRKLEPKAIRMYLPLVCAWTESTDPIAYVNVVAVKKSRIWTCVHRLGRSASRRMLQISRRRIYDRSSRAAMHSLTRIYCQKASAPKANSPLTTEYPSESTEDTSTTTTENDDSKRINSSVRDKTRHRLFFYGMTISSLLK